MKYQLIFLNRMSKYLFAHHISPFVFVHKKNFKDNLAAVGIYEIPEAIILEADENNCQNDFAILHLLRSHPIFKSCPLLVFTRKLEATNVLEYFEHGATTCVLKPIQGKEWFNVIENIQLYREDAAWPQVSV